MAKHPQNGPTFTKATHKRPRVADLNKPARPNPEVGEDETARLAAKSRGLSKLLNTDMEGALKALGLPKKK